MHPSLITLQIQQKEAFTHVLIQGDLTIYAATELNGLLGDVIKQHDQLEIDLSQVQEVDSAGLQVLFFIQTEATRQQKSVIYSHLPEEMTSLLQLYNLTEKFNTKKQ